MIAMKFGGTSVGSVDAFKQVVGIVQRAVEQEAAGPRPGVIVVTSAMSGVTNTLIEAADAFGSITFADAATGQIIALSNGNPQVKVLMPDSSGRIELERSAGPDRPRRVRRHVRPRRRQPLHP